MGRSETHLASDPLKVQRPQAQRMALREPHGTGNSGPQSLDLSLQSRRLLRSSLSNSGKRMNALMDECKRESTNR